MKEIKEEAKIFNVVGNTDNTEGKGRSVNLFTCWNKQTALRLAKKKGVMGSDAHVYESTAYKIGNVWFTVGDIVRPTNEDETVQKQVDEIEDLKKKALKLGLTELELRKISNIS